MAARWGAGEDILTACNMDFFTTNPLDETVCLGSGESLEALHGCLDPSILSIFEDTPTGEAKGLDEESEATLLTALTEILDNVDDENLSPFDTLPDSDLLSGQKGREHSPLRRLLCLSRSPPERDTICNIRAFSTGKSLPRTQAGSIQRSDGEEEEDCSLTLSPVSQPSSPDKELLDWGGLTLPLPLTLEQEGEDGDSVSVSLGDLVRHMHPYCMAVSVENGVEEMLPEGGILLEVVDQGEYGEPILAIPDTDLPLSLPTLQDFSDKEHALPDESEEAFSEDSEHIIVDDDVEDTASEAPVKVAGPVIPAPSSEVKGEKVVKRPKEEMREKIPSRRKKKKKSKKEAVQPEDEVPPVEGRVLRSTSARRATWESPQKLSKKTIKEEKKKKASLVPQASTLRLNACQAEMLSEVTTLTLPPEPSVKVTVPVAVTSDLVKASPERSQPSCPPTVVICPQPMETPKLSAPEKLEVLSAATSAAPHATPQAPALSSDCPSAPLVPVTPQLTIPPSEVPPPVAPQPTEVAAPPPAPEPKPKPLSLEEYRRLRQQKKPAPVEKQEDHSTKWPSLPELPKELPPIPCLPAPNPRDARRPQPPSGKKEVVEVKTAWQPMGPGAPPTPEALLVPPAYMVASSSKVASATLTPKLQQASALQPAKSSQPPSAASPCPVKSSSPPTQATSLPAKPCVPQSSSSVSASQHMPPAENLPSSAPSVDEAGASERPHLKHVSFKPVVVNEVPSKTTTEPLKSTTSAAVSAQIPISAPQKTTSTVQKLPQHTAVAPVSDPVRPGPSKPTVPSTQPASSQVAHPLIPSQNLKAKRFVAGVKMRPSAAPEAPRAKSPTQELIEAFTSEIGIEAADLTSLLEQFEESQAKEEQCVPEVCGRAAAVGNSSVELPQEKTAVERIKAHDLSSTAALTPPATPPHQMWKPLAPVALLGKSRVAEASKPSPAKVIQIDPRPLPSIKLRSKPTTAAATVAPALACMDHDYCLPNKDASTDEPGKRWNVKQQPSITIKTIQRSTPATTQPHPSTPASSPQATTHAVVTKTQESPLMEPLDHRTESSAGSSVLETPDASPARQEADGTPEERSPRRGPSRRSYRRHTSSRSPSPRPSPKERERKRGRSRRRGSHRSPSPSSSSSESRSSSTQSRSHSPPKKRYRPRHSRSSSSSSSSRSSSCSSRSVSCSPPRRRRYSYSSSQSGSWSRSRSRSCSPQRLAQWGRSRRLYSPSNRPNYRLCARESPEEVKRRKEKAIEERRVVYVGRIRGTMTRKELRERFSLYGEIEECTLHFRDHGDNYGFVTYYDTKDAFTAIENGSKLRNPDELPFDLCFGGRRQFCQTSYSDLDSNKEYDPLPAKGKFHALDFDTLLKQAQKNLKR